MTCPDDNLFAKAQAGQLSPEEAAAYQRHLDGCPSCLELAVVLGCIAEPMTETMEGSVDEEHASSRQVFAKPLPIQVTSRDPMGYGALFALSTMILCHGYWSYCFVPLAWKTLFALWNEADVLIATVKLALAVYTLVWGTLGICWGLVSLAAVKNRWKAVRRLLTTYVILSGPSLALIPVSVCVWFTSTSDDTAAPRRARDANWSSL